MKSTPLLTVALIAKDAEATIGRTISSIIDVAGEVVLVLDDRTTDRTEQIARDCAGSKLRLKRRKWNHHFASARNESVAMSRGRFVMVMDADDEVEVEDLPKLREALEGDVDLLTFPRFLDGSYDTAMYYNERFGGWCNIDYHNFVFRRDKRPHYVGRVHEHLRFPVPWKEKEVGVRVYHRGTGTELKTKYYMALMLLEYMENPQNEIACIYLAEDACGRGNPVEASGFLEVLDPDKEPFHPVMMARYWCTSGLAFQIAYRLARQNGNDPQDSYQNACEDYRRASEINPTWTNPVIRLVTFQVSVAVASSPSQAVPILDEARGTLEDLMKRDPTNLMAGRLLETLTEGRHDQERIRELWEREVKALRARESPSLPERGQHGEGTDQLRDAREPGGAARTRAAGDGGGSAAAAAGAETAHGRTEGADAPVHKVHGGLRIVQPGVRGTGGDGDAARRPEAEVCQPGQRLSGPDGASVHRGLRAEHLAPGAVPLDGSDGGGAEGVGEESGAGGRGQAF